MKNGQPRTNTEGMLLGSGGSGGPVVVAGPDSQPLVIGTYIRGNEQARLGVWVELDLEKLIE